MGNRKVTIVGAGNVGATTAHLIVLKQLADVVLIDVVEGIPQGKALDMQQSCPIEGCEVRITGTNSYEDTKDSDVVIITAGMARKPGMTREDLLLINERIVKEVTEKIVKQSPKCIIIVVTNPIDAMVQVVKSVSGFPKSRVIGMAGTLDTARFKTFIAKELNVSVKEVEAFVLGSHGDSMVPLVSHAKVKGKPLASLMKKERIDAIVKRTREGGAEIVSLLKTGSAFYAPASSIVEIVESIIKDSKKILPCIVYLDGEYGIKDLFFGAVARIGRNGAEEAIELKLSDEEEKQIASSAEHVRSSIGKIKV